MHVTARTPLIGIVLLTLSLLAAGAEAQGSGTSWSESVALRRFHSDIYLGGHHQSPRSVGRLAEVRTRFRATFRWIHDGNLVVGDLEQDHFDGSTK